MELHNDQVFIVERKCSKFAAELLQDLRRHPKLPQLLERLRVIEGIIFRSDIENAFLAVMNSTESQPVTVLPGAPEIVKIDSHDAAGTYGTRSAGNYRADPRRGAIREAEEPDTREGMGGARPSDQRA